MSVLKRKKKVPKYGKDVVARQVKAAAGGHCWVQMRTVLPQMTGPEKHSGPVVRVKAAWVRGRVVSKANAADYWMLDVPLLGRDVGFHRSEFVTVQPSTYDAAEDPGAAVGGGTTGPAAAAPTEGVALKQ